MVSRRIIILGAAGVIFATAGNSADAAALAFVTAIYDAYKGKNSKGVPLGTAAEIRHYFEPTLAAVLIKDQRNSARHNDVGKLDSDPFIDGQDWEIKAVTINLTDTAIGKASAKVSFRNFDQPTTVVLDLVKIKNDWRVNDITWRHEGKAETLRGLFGR